MDARPNLASALWRRIDLDVDPVRMLLHELFAQSARADPVFNYVFPPYGHSAEK